MARTLFALLYVLLIPPASAQDWSRGLRVNGSPATICTIGNAAENGVIVAGYMATDSVYCAVLNAQGEAVRAWTMERMGLAAVSLDRNRGYYLLGKLEGDLVLTRFDTLGGVIWSERIDVEGPDSVEWYPRCAIVQFDTIPPDSSSYDYVITLPAGEQNWRTLRLNKDGVQRWCDDHQGLQQFSPQAVPLALPNGNVLVGGGAGSPVIQCIDPNGQTLWMRRYPTSNNNVRVTALYHTPGDSVFALIGNSSASDSWWSIMKIDGGGDVDWSKRIELIGHNITLNHIFDDSDGLTVKVYGTVDNDYGGDQLERFPIFIGIWDSFVWPELLLSQLMPYPVPTGTEDPDWEKSMVSRRGVNLIRAGNYYHAAEDTAYSIVTAALYSSVSHCHILEESGWTTWINITEQDHLFSGSCAANMVPYAVQSWSAYAQAFDHCPVSYPNPMGLNESDEPDDLIIQPNPSSGIFNVRPPSGFTGRSDVHLMDLTGRVVPAQIDRSVDGTIEVRVQPGAKGMFLLQLQSAQRRWSGRIIVD